MNLPVPNARSEAQVSWGVLIFSPPCKRVVHCHTFLIVPAGSSAVGVGDSSHFLLAPKFLSAGPSELFWGFLHGDVCRIIPKMLLNFIFMAQLSLKFSGKMAAFITSWRTWTQYLLYNLNNGKVTIFWPELLLLSGTSFTDSLLLFKKPGRSVSAHHAVWRH